MKQHIAKSIQVKISLPLDMLDKLIKVIEQGGNIFIISPSPLLKASKKRSLRFA